jgi:hypothetical protein
MNLIFSLIIVEYGLETLIKNIIISDICTF